MEKFICWKHTGKMEGLASFSSSVLCNPYCAIRRGREGGICEHCFAAAQMKRYGAQRDKLEKATAFITADVIPVDEMPLLNVAYFRLEAFGDLINTTQAVDYLNLCYANPHVKFALWTKNPGILNGAVKRVGKPSNLIVVLSSEKVNEIAPRAEYWLASGLIDKVFTVWATEADAKAAGVEINCGARHCLTCRACYENNGIIYIHELLK